MSKEKDFFRELMRLFVSGSIYILMFIVAAYIFYMTLFLCYKVVFAIIVHVSHLGDMTAKWIAEAWDMWIKLTEEILSVVTIILVLVKSFKILVEYSKHHHIQIRDLVEIAIIALLMEVVFNFSIHSMAINWLFAVFGATLLVIYAMFPYFRREKLHKTK